MKQNNIIKYYFQYIAAPCRLCASLPAADSDGSGKHFSSPLRSSNHLKESPVNSVHNQFSELASSIDNEDAKMNAIYTPKHMSKVKGRACSGNICWGGGVALDGFIKMDRI